jgi:cyclophilin family peptidyl-prolyl cis-trans isomerase
MANRSPNNDGSQFLLSFGLTTHTDGLHTVFGDVHNATETLKVLENWRHSVARPVKNLE